MELVWRCSIFLILLTAGALAQFEDIAGDYCGGRIQRCCDGRIDSCAIPILGTLCYCDQFCNRTDSSDCCPDYWNVCLGIKPPSPLIQQRGTSLFHLFSGENVQSTLVDFSIRMLSWRSKLPLWPHGANQLQQVVSIYLVFIMHCVGTEHCRIWICNARQAMEMISLTRLPVVPFKMDLVLLNYWWKKFFFFLIMLLFSGIDCE
jgi:hypothetical protein